MKIYKNNKTNDDKHFLQMYRSLTDLKSWEEQLQLSLQCVQLSSEVQSEAELTLAHERIGVALTALRNHLKAIIEFQQPQDLFSGDIHLFRTREAGDIDYCGLKKVTVNRTGDKSLPIK